MKRLRLTISFNSLLAYRYNHFVTVIVTFLPAICDGKTNPYGACTLRYTNDRILKRDGSVHTVSGGTCSSPDRCTGCNDGFYSTGPYCESKTQNWITLQMLCCEKFMHYFNLSILLMLEYFVNVLQNSILKSLPPNKLQDRCWKKFPAYEIVINFVL